MTTIQEKFKSSAERFLLEGQKLRIATDINGTLLGTNGKQPLGDKNVPANIRLLKFLILAKLAGHDVHAFTNDPNQNARTFQLFAPRVIYPLFAELSVNDDDRERVMREVFGKQDDGSYDMMRKDLRTDLVEFEDGVDIVFEDEDVSWAGPVGIVFRPESDLEIAFLDDFIANPHAIKPVNVQEYLPLPWAQNDHS